MRVPRVATGDIAGMPPANRDAAIAAVVRTQLGLITRKQLLEFGLGERTVKRWRASGRLAPVRRGVYAYGYWPPSGDAVRLAAVLASSRSAVVGGRSAAAHHEMLQSLPGPVHLIVPSGGRAAEGIILHRPRLFEGRDWQVMRGVPVTTPERTLVDLAASSPWWELRTAVRQAERRGLLDPSELQRLCVVKRRGIRKLRSILAEYRPAFELTRSDLEVRFVGLVSEAGLPLPAINVEVAGLEVDFCWRRERLIVEVDGYEFHRGRASFEEDRARDAKLTIAGFNVIRFTFKQVVRDRSTIVALLRRRLAPR